MSLFDAINHALGASEAQAGTGQNLLGSDLVQRLAARVGLPPEVATALLSRILPQAVDRLTPEGTVPAGGLLGQATGLLRGLR